MQASRTLPRVVLSNLVADYKRMWKLNTQGLERCFLQFQRNSPVPSPGLRRGHAHPVAYMRACSQITHIQYK